MPWRRQSAVLTGSEAPTPVNGSHVNLPTRSRRHGIGPPARSARAAGSSRRHPWPPRTVPRAPRAAPGRRTSPLAPSKPEPIPAATRGCPPRSARKRSNLPESSPPPPSQGSTGLRCHPPAVVRLGGGEEGGGGYGFAAARVSRDRGRRAASSVFRYP
ncbi:hypothetical protein PVAP13_5NG356081 [Panicum virgatum]|uniref:Uncharacterized protein n=1 Tax=Panicum virgatum TaxID=38727 RepID=A0A8T0RVS1_PANVG|nr:hypothetical protein PVAP13_5NG356081 [Panicum virgatum]